MKRKIIVPLLLASIAGGVVATTTAEVKASYAQQSIVTDVTGQQLALTGFVETGKLGYAVALPKATGVNLDYELINPSGNKVTNIKNTGSEPAESDEGVSIPADTDYFVPTVKGAYYLTYTSSDVNQIKTKTNALRIFVMGEDFTIELTQNSKFIVPTTIPVTTTNALKIPQPKVKKSDKYESDADVTSNLQVSVSDKSGTVVDITSTIDATASFYEFMPTTVGVHEIVYKYTKGGSVLDYVTERFVVKQNYKSDDIVLNFDYATSVPTTAVIGKETVLPKINIKDSTSGNSIAGYTNIVVKHIDGTVNGEIMPVEYVDGQFKFTPTKEGNYRVTYKAELDYFGKISREHSFIIENVIDNETPKWNFANPYITVALEEIEVLELKLNADIAVLDDVVDAEEIAALKLAFEVAKTDLLKSEKRNIVSKIFDRDGKVIYNKDDVENLSLTKKEVDAKILTLMGNESHALTSIGFLEKTTVEGVDKFSFDVVFPAIYATDNATGLGDLTFTRQIRKVNGAAVTIGVDKFNETVVHQIDSAGKYTITYIIKDKAGMLSRQSYTLVVLADDTTLNVKNESTGNLELALPESPRMQALPAFVKEGSKISFTKPTAIDPFDDRVGIRTYYAIKNNPVDADWIEFTTTNDLGLMELNLKNIAGITSADKIYIEARAYNDYNKGNYSSVRATVSLIKGSSDLTKPEIFFETDFLEQLANINKYENTETAEYRVGADGYFVEARTRADSSDAWGAWIQTTEELFKQNEYINIPTVQLKDQLDANLEVSVNVFDSRGKEISLTGSKFEQNGKDASGNYTFTIKDAKFIANYSGMYTVNFSAKDAGGNIITQTFGIRIKDSVPPAIDMSNFDSVFSKTHELGKFFEVPAPMLIDQGKALDVTLGYDEIILGEAGLTWTLVNAKNASNISARGFTPTAEDTYTIIYKGWDKTGNIVESIAREITVEDTIKPTIELEHHSADKEYSFETGETTQLTFPSIKAWYDGYYDSNNDENSFTQTHQDDIMLSVKLTYPDGTEAELTKDAFGEYVVEAEKQGQYKVIYRATDKSGLTTEVVVIARVGDTVRPEIDLVDDYKVITEASVGDSFEFNTNKLELSDDETENEKLLDSLKISMIGPDGREVTSIASPDFKWKFEEVGTYELRVTITDEAGNNSDRTPFKIVVSEKESKKSIIAPWLGTTLIVVASVTLLGVVGYFVITSRKNKAPAKSSRTRTRR